MSRNSPQQTLSDDPDRLVSRLIFAVCARALRHIRRGSVELVLPWEDRRTFGTLGSGPHASVRVHNAGLFWKSLRRGTVGFAESYIDGDFDTPNLAEVFAFFLDNKPDLKKGGHGWFRVRGRDRNYHGARDNSLDGARLNIAEHYDLGNPFYALWLDETMTYSSAWFTEPGQSLEAAQRHKYDRVLEALGENARGRVLEIGCGWGGFAEHAGRAGALVDAITISREQLRYTQERIKASGLSGRVAVREQDYRLTTGQYDGIVSIEMIEAVGERYWPRYFRTIYDRLRRGGSAVIQSITISDDFFDTYRRQVDFIQRYIFPGGMLPSPSVIRREAESVGLRLEGTEHFGASYARTLWAWRHRFHANWPAIRELGFDERFRRLWDYYLTYCAVGFERGTINVGLYRLNKPA
jgi:cyclopropane-fatty-acyl-phospholipid synthase